MKLIIIARLLPDGTTVTKPTGTTPYTLKHRLRVFGVNADIASVFKSISDKIMFLIGEHGEINAITDETELAVHFDDMSDLRQFVDEQSTPV